MTDAEIEENIACMLAQQKYEDEHTDSDALQDDGSCLKECTDRGLAAMIEEDSPIGEALRLIELLTGGRNGGERVMPEYEPIFIDRESYNCGYDLDRELGIYIWSDLNSHRQRPGSGMCDGDE